MPEWTFITRHAVALSIISKHPRITALELGKEMGMTERAVRKIIADLASLGYIEKKRQGRGVEYTVNHELTLRRHTHRDIAVGDLLAAISGNKNQDE
jgi:predicted transcriptional regulator